MDAAPSGATAVPMDTAPSFHIPEGPRAAPARALLMRAVSFGSFAVAPDEGAGAAMVGAAGGISLKAVGMAGTVAMGEGATGAEVTGATEEVAVGTGAMVAGAATVVVAAAGTRMVVAGGGGAGAGGEAGTGGRREGGGGAEARRGAGGAGASSSMTGTGPVLRKGASPFRRARIAQIYRLFASRLSGFVGAPNPIPVWRHTAQVHLRHLPLSPLTLSSQNMPTLYPCAQMHAHQLGAKTECQGAAENIYVQPTVHLYNAPH